MSALVLVGERRPIPRSLLDPDPRNATLRGPILPTDAKVIELSASIREHGQVEPMVARPHPDGSERFMLVIGHRRDVALGLAGVDEADVIVRELGDAEAFALMVVENDHRAPLSPLGEARAFRELVEIAGSVSKAAARASKPADYLRERLTLLELDSAVQQRLASGRLPVEHALSIARLPPELHVEAANAVELPDGSVLSLRDATLLLRTRFTLRLDEAPFDRGDFELFEEAGPCTTCSKRSGAQGELFASAPTADVCLDPKCFSEKRERAWDKLAGDHERLHQPVFEGKEARRALEDPAYVDLEGKCPRDADGRRWREVLGDKAVRKVPTVLARDDDKRVHLLVLRDDVRGAKLAPSAREIFDGHEQALQQQLDQELSERQREERREKAVRRAIEQIVLRVEGGPLGDELARELAVAAIEVSWPEVLKAVAARMGIGKGVNASEELVNAARQLPASNALALVVELLLTRASTRGEDPLGAGSPLARVLAACGPAPAKAAAAKAKAAKPAKGKDGPAKGKDGRGVARKKGRAK